MTFGEALAAEIKASGLTQREVAAKVGVPQPVLWKYMQDLVRPRFGTLFKLLATFPKLSVWVLTETMSKW